MCSTINPSALSEITDPSINGTVVQSEVCALAAIDFASPSLASFVEGENRVGVTYLTTALFAVQVAGGYAGGTNLNTLCSEIEATLIDDLFIGFVPDVGTAVKNYVCSAASATPSQGTAIPSATFTSVPYPANSTVSGS